MAILVTVVAGEALNRIQDMEDEDVVKQCMEALKKMFPEHVSGKKNATVEPYNVLLNFRMFHR